MKFINILSAVVFLSNFILFSLANDLPSLFSLKFIIPKYADQKSFVLENDTTVTILATLTTSSTNFESIPDININGLSFLNKVYTYLDSVIVPFRNGKMHSQENRMKGEYIWTWKANARIMLNENFGFDEPQIMGVSASIEGSGNFEISCLDFEMVIKKPPVKHIIQETVIEDPLNIALVNEESSARPETISPDTSKAVEVEPTKRKRSRRKIAESTELQSHHYPGLYKSIMCIIFLGAILGGFLYLIKMIAGDAVQSISDVTQFQGGRCNVINPTRRDDICNKYNCVSGFSSAKKIEKAFLQNKDHAVLELRNDISKSAFAKYLKWYSVIVQIQGHTKEIQFNLWSFRHLKNPQEVVSLFNNIGSDKMVQTLKGKDEGLVLMNKGIVAIMHGKSRSILVLFETQ